jgi:hypothetical protein
MVTVVFHEKRAFLQATRNELRPAKSIQRQKRAATSCLVPVQIVSVPMLFRVRPDAEATVIWQEKLKKSAFLFANSKKSS